MTNALKMITGGLCITANLATYPAYAQSAEQTETTERAPDHCIYLYAAASSRMADAVDAIVSKFEAYDEIGYANDAVQLAIALNCPMPPMIAAIECSVGQLIQQDTFALNEIQIVNCVEFDAGHPLPKFSD